MSRSSISAPVLLPRTQQYEDRAALWHTAAIAPPRFTDSVAYSLHIPSYTKTPADKFVCSLLDGCGMEWGGAHVDIRRNITLIVWVDVERVDSTVQQHKKHMLKMKLEPGMFIRAPVVTLDSYVNDDGIEGTSAPLWMERLANIPGASPLDFIRVYSWVYLVIGEVLATPDVAVPYVSSWFSLLEYVGHIKDLWDAAARPRPNRVIRPRPARRSVDIIAAALEGTNIAEA